MPQADLSFSSHIPIDVTAALTTVETVIATHDSGSGACKGRAHPVVQTHHDHVLLRVRMLNKPHRDDSFMQTLLAALEEALTPLIPTACFLNIELGFLEPHYATAILK